MYKILYKKKTRYKSNFLLLFAQILTRFIETQRPTVHARNLSWWFDVHWQMCRSTECLWASASWGLLYESQDNALVLNSGPCDMRTTASSSSHFFFFCLNQVLLILWVCVPPHMLVLLLSVFCGLQRMYHTAFSSILKVPTVDKVLRIGESSTLLPGCSFTVYI